MYGLKQSARQWYRRFDPFMVKIGFIRSSFDSYLYFKDIVSDKAVYLFLYVDDMLITGPNLKIIQSIKELLNSEFDKKDLGPAKKILGISILKNRKKLEMKLL